MYGPYVRLKRNQRPNDRDLDVVGREPDELNCEQRLPAEERGRETRKKKGREGERCMPLVFALRLFAFVLEGGADLVEYFGEPPLSAYVILFVIACVWRFFAGWRAAVLW